MPFQTRRYQVPFWVGAILTLLTCGVVLPATAQAGCSAHFVSSHALVGDQSAHFELLSSFGALATSRNESQHQPPATPCTGALCSGKNGTPVPALPRILPLGFGQWAFLTAFHATRPSLGRLLPAPEPASHPLDHAADIFHPPRVPLG